jgi:hypothetical protein
MPVVHETCEFALFFCHDLLLLRRLTHFIRYDPFCPVSATEPREVAPSLHPTFKNHHSKSSPVGDMTQVLKWHSPFRFGYYGSSEKIRVSKEESDSSHISPSNGRLFTPTEVFEILLRSSILRSR